jgi:hypothetical protein
MDLTIRIDGGAGEELLRWISADPAVRRYAAGAVPEPPEPGSGAMGTGLDVLNLVLPNATALGSLVVSIATFRDQRRQSTGAAPTVTVGSARTVVVVDGDPAAVVRQLSEAAGAAGATEVAEPTEP